MKKQLTEINVTKENGELLTSINFDTMNVINTDDVVVRFNYGAPKNFIDVEGKIHIEEN